MKLALQHARFFGFFQTMKPVASDLWFVNVLEGVHRCLNVLMPGPTYL